MLSFPEPFQGMDIRIQIRFLINKLFRSSIKGVRKDVGKGGRNAARKVSRKVSGYQGVGASVMENVENCFDKRSQKSIGKVIQ
jgi:hypothetical protein